VVVVVVEGVDVGGEGDEAQKSSYWSPWQFPNSDETGWGSSGLQEVFPEPAEVGAGAGSESVFRQRGEGFVSAADVCAGSARQLYGWVVDLKVRPRGPSES